ncbi:uncharacterized protein LOC135358771 [Latimeria chalumnae]|uniref:uncharacterized protein LOC135358771 n=1 Tax=Latimeria chalumnae TaxID=7897 RepID=UPI00313D39A8
MVTILFSNEIVPEADISFWLNRQTTVLGDLHPIHDSNGLWNGGYRVKVQLESIGNEVIHLPNSINIGRDKGWLFYPGQPKNCHKCGASDHFSSSCNNFVCRNCGKTGHITRNCTEKPVCNLCFAEGHYYINCPHSATNHPPENVITSQEYDQLIGESATTGVQNETTIKELPKETATEDDQTAVEPDSGSVPNAGKEEDGSLSSNSVVAADMEDSLMELKGKGSKKTDEKSRRDPIKKAGAMEYTEVAGAPSRGRREKVTSPLWSDRVEEISPSVEAVQEKKMRKFKGTREVTRQNMEVEKEADTGGRQLRSKKLNASDLSFEAVKRKKKKKKRGFSRRRASGSHPKQERV